MSESLSQNEVDLLFGKGMQHDSHTAGELEVRTYDFRKPARISKDRNRSLVAMYGVLVKAVEGWVTGRVREQIEVELQGVEQITFGEFVLALPSPCASYVVDIRGAGRQGVIDFGHELAFYMTDRLLGGTARHALPPRPLTAIERRVVQIVAERVATLLSDAWKDYVRLDLAVSGFESIPEMLRVANREDPVLVANLVVSTQDMASGLLLCLPFNTVEKFFTGATARRPEQPLGTPEERHIDRQMIESSVRDSRIAVGARLPRFEVSMAELSALEPGSILTTGLDHDAELEIYAAGQRRFTGVPGRVGRHLAVRVTGTMSPEPDHIIEAGRILAPTL